MNASTPPGPLVDGWRTAGERLADGWRTAGGGCLLRGDVRLVRHRGQSHVPKGGVPRGGASGPESLDVDGAAVVAFDDEVDLVLAAVGAQTQTTRIRES